MNLKKGQRRQRRSVSGAVKRGKQQKAKREARRSGVYCEVMVAAHVCTPVRDKITGTLDPYRVQYRGLKTWSVWQDGSTGKDGDYMRSGKDGQEYASRFVGTLRVRKEAVKWAEYLLVRSGQFELLHTPYTPKYRQAGWAARDEWPATDESAAKRCGSDEWKKQMPKPWEGWRDGGKVGKAGKSAWRFITGKGL